MPATCFVIMPFGDKVDTENGGKRIDFDKIYEYLFKETIEGMGINCVRCDHIAEAGWIHAKMFNHIYKAEVALVDITSLNPNVFYELGVRHTLAEHVTVLLRRKGTSVPFNIQGFTVIDYDDQDIASVKETKKKIVDFISNGLKLRKKDSPVHAVLNLKIGTVPKALTKTEIFRYRLQNAPGKQICLITGDLREAKGIDVWVNSENTNMQMARHYDRSVSSVIRYCGAVKKCGQIVDDTIAKELTKAAGDPANVPAGEIVVTGAGELERTHGVKKIFHAASVAGQVGAGYAPITDIGVCVRNALRTGDAEDCGTVAIRSILFPLMGTGTARGDVEQKAGDLIGAAIAYMEANPHSRIEKVYFLCWSENDLQACQHVLEQSPDVVAALDRSACKAVTVEA